MLYVIGLGLGGIKDISSDVITILKSCQKIYLETYTSVILNADGEFRDIVSDLKNLIDTDAEYFTADREMVESGTQIVNSLKSGNTTGFLVVGDSLSSATHTDLILRVLEEGLSYKILNNTSIMTAISVSGLRLKQFCQTVSIPFWDNGIKQPSILDKIESNLRRGKHTLCLLDIKVKERTIENIVRDRPIYEPPRFMTCSTAATQLLECLDDDNKFFLTGNTLCIGMARVGCDTEKIFVGTLSEVALFSDEKLGGPLHSLLIAGNCNDLEREFLENIERNYHKKEECLLHFIGVDSRGLQSLSIGAIETLRACTKLYLEMYTQLIQNDGHDIVQRIQSLIGPDKDIVIVEPTLKETAQVIVQSAKQGNQTAYVVLGDPMSFSSHTEVALLALKEGVRYSINHSTSMQTAVGRCGLTLVALDTVTIPLSSYDSHHESFDFIDSIKENLKQGLHTLCRLPVAVVNSKLTPMTCGATATVLIEGGMSGDTLAVGMARLGCPDERILVGTLVAMAGSDRDLGPPIHCLVIVGRCHDLELAFLNQFVIGNCTAQKLYERHGSINFCE